MHAHVHGDGLVAAEALDGLFLQDAQQFGLRVGVMSPISSRKIVPPLACSKRPMRRAAAPVKAPRSWPKSSLSSRVSGMAAQLTAMNGLAARSLCW